ADDIAAVERFGVRHHGEKNGCLGTLRRAQHEWLRQPPPEPDEAAALSDPGGNEPGMQAGSDDLTGIEPRPKLSGEKDVAEFGAAIGPHNCPIVRTCQTARIDAVAAMRLRSDCDDPCRRRGL